MFEICYALYSNLLLSFEITHAGIMLFKREAYDTQNIILCFIEITIFMLD